MNDWLQDATNYNDNPERMTQAHQRMRASFDWLQCGGLPEAPTAEQFARRIGVPLRSGLEPGQLREREETRLLQAQQDYLRAALGREPDSWYRDGLALYADRGDGTLLAHPSVIPSEKMQRQNRGQ
jgi:hypothetical protein